MIKTEVQQVDEMRVLDEAFFQMAVMMRSAWMALPILSFVVVVGLWRHTNHFILIGWFLSALTVQMIRYREVRKYFAISPKGKLAIRWVWYVTWLAFIEGKIWGLGYTYFLFQTPCRGRLAIKVTI